MSARTNAARRLRAALPAGFRRRARPAAVRRAAITAALPAPPRLALAFALALALAGCSRGDGAPGTSATPPLGAGETPSRLEAVPELFVDPEARPDEGAPPLRVRFRANVEDATGAVTCEWDFGDGSPKVAETNPTHVYERIGDYEIFVTCRDGIGTPGEGETDVFVEADEDAAPDAPAPAS